MENVEKKPVRYAGFGVRFTAWGIDSTLIQLIAILVAYLLGQAAMAQDAQQNLDQLVRMGWVPAAAQGQTINDILMLSGVSGSGSMFSGSDMAIYLVCSAFYHIWFTASGWQATPGKRWCKIMVIMESGLPLSLSMSAIRWFARFMSWFTLGFGFIQILWNKQKISMHDAICGTRVVYRQ